MLLRLSSERLPLCAAITEHSALVQHYLPRRHGRLGLVTGFDRPSDDQHALHSTYHRAFLDTFDHAQSVRKVIDAYVVRKARAKQPVADYFDLVFDELQIPVHRWHSDVGAAKKKRLREDQRQVPCEFWPHHGSLSKELREDAEAANKDASRPATAVCTSTLELGIDIGAIKSVAQIGPPASVASLRQRLGRSGRTDNASILRVYIQEPALSSDTRPLDALRSDLVETIAMLELLLSNWCEASDPRGLHLSTIVHQVLSMVAQHGGLRADDAWRASCQGGPFEHVDQGLFLSLLRSMGSHNLVTQDGAGDLVLAHTGEQIVNHYSFYAAFSAPKEYRVTAGGRLLGTAPFTESLFPGRHVIFGGRRWIVSFVDEQAKVVDLRPASGGRPPAFAPRAPTPVHDEVRHRMATIYKDSTVPSYLNDGARSLLAEGRAAYYRCGLDKADSSEMAIEHCSSRGPAIEYWIRWRYGLRRAPPTFSSKGLHW